MTTMRTFAVGLSLLVAVAGCSGSDPAQRNAAYRGLSEDPSCANTLTAYPGDCRVPPKIDPSVGFVAHYGPRDYDDPQAVQDYVLQPGQELTDCTYSKLGNTTDFFYDRYDIYWRPGAHHTILYAGDASIPDGTHDDCTLRAHDSLELLGVLQGGIDGSVFHYPPSGVIAPENVGVAKKVAAGQSVAFELHAVNATDQPLLREGWMVFFSKPASEVTESAAEMTFDGGLGMQIPAHTQAIVSNSCAWSGPGEIRILDLFAHMHAHGKRLSAWAVQQDATGQETRTLVYESYDWSILDLIQFDSVTQNRPITYAGGAPGGMSGILRLAPSDRIEYECAIDNTTDSTLTYEAAAFTGEMCNLFGTFAPGTSQWSCVGE